MTSPELRDYLRALGEPESSIDYLIASMRVKPPVTPINDDELLRAFIDDDIVDGNAPALTPNPSTGD